jgi:alpha-1,3-fucosyltransferase
MVICSSDETQCLEQLERTYKFYLSFENSFCEDYITEKFFKILRFDIIPVVLGGGNYSKIAPARSFINANDFNSILDLANYLQYLDKNATAYAEYFEWKNYFEVVQETSSAFCKLCESLHNKNVGPKSYDDIFKWWRTDAHCVKKGRFPWSKTSLESSIDFFKHKIFSAS